MKGRPIKGGDRGQRVGDGLRTGASMKGRPIESGDVPHYMSVDWPQIHFTPR